MASLPLHRFPAVHTTSIDEAVELFGRMTTPARFERIDRARRFAWRGNHLSLGAIELSAHAYGAAFGARTESVQGIFTTAFPLADVSSVGIDAGSELPVVRDESTWFASPDRPGGFRVGTGYRALQLTVRQADMEAALASLVGDGTPRPLRLEPALSLRSGAGAWLARLVRFAVEEADRPESPFASPLVRARFADTVLYGIVTSHPHDRSALLARSRTAEPKHVRDAAEYLEAHAADPVRLGDLASITGVGVRALQLGFQRHRGCSPMEFLQERRLQRARATLLAGTTDTITRVAVDCGFAHVGRFSALYRARFGESPSETRARQAR